MNTGHEAAASAGPGAARDRLRFQRIDFALWRQEIAPLWHMEGAVHLVAPLVNGYGQLQYCGRELHARVRHVPLAAELDGVRIAWTSIYNISDEALRLRGIYVLPEWRSNGVGRAIVAHAISLWPAGFGRVFLYARLGNVGRYRRWGFEIVPGHVPRSHRTGIEGGQERIVQMMLRRAVAAPFGGGDAHAPGATRWLSP
ncbi:MAG: GNAT family N-acetyltransferase [Alphaproteobacteria bacterium]|nr:GNAT family N-acetyltransferase [Alphaproteobacteria bacterium]